MNDKKRTAEKEVILGLRSKDELVQTTLRYRKLWLASLRRAKEYEYILWNLEQHARECQRLQTDQSPYKERIIEATQATGIRTILDSMGQKPHITNAHSQPTKFLKLRLISSDNKKQEASNG
ncbi:MAG: hypothetical protein LBC43_03950 [Bifidobacteriaceae bacterium]|nr:hypothetical protein [Bifidobacteriaceae bacterium]